MTASASHPNAAAGAADRVAVVTGGARGIGATLSTALAEDANTVVIADPHEAGADLAARLCQRGHRAEHLPTDVTDESAVNDLVAHCARRHGRIDVLVNNAGRYRDLGTKRHFTEITSADWDQVFAVNAKGVWLMTKAVYPLMRGRGFGRIVNIASATVHRGTPYFAHYVASKGAVIALTRSIANEIGRDGITVNAIAPGLVDNEATRLVNEPGYAEAAAARRAIARPMEPSDLVGAVRFLCSAASGFMTGQTLVVDGGTTFI